MKPASETRRLAEEIYARQIERGNFVPGEEKLLAARAIHAAEVFDRTYHDVEETAAEAVELASVHVARRRKRSRR